MTTARNGHPHWLTPDHDDRWAMLSHGLDDRDDVPAPNLTRPTNQTPQDTEAPTRTQATGQPPAPGLTCGNSQNDHP
jgi:hypothetical protein